MGVGRIPLSIAGTMAAGVLGIVIAGAVCFAQSAHAPAPTDAAPAANKAVPKIRPTRIGVNVPAVTTYSGQRIYANLAAHAEWMYANGGAWKAIDPALLDRRGWIKSLPPGASAPLPLMHPELPFTTLKITCTYEGTGSLGAGGIFRVQGRGDHHVDLLATAGTDPAMGGWLVLETTSPQDPLRNIDCREASVAKGLLFAPELIAYLRQFRVLRFVDWSGANANQAGNWAQRNTPDHFYQGGPQGVAVEHQVELANLAGADGWFLLPYNADDTYIENFARYVHDHLKPGHVAYVELGNEIWNLGFPAAQQAMREGQAEQLGGGDAHNAMLQRYAEKSRNALAIWTRIFADNPARLVRVVSTQNVWTDTARQVLGFKDTARYVDALATAPYFQLDGNAYSVATIDKLFADLDVVIDKAIDLAGENQRIAAQYGKRFIAYEGGQHLLARDMVLSQRIQRDPRMGKAYARYLAGWQAKIGDLLTLYAATGPISPYGSWGLREYAVQPVEEAPKLKAVQAFLGSH